MNTKNPLAPHNDQLHPSLITQGTTINPPHTTSITTTLVIKYGTTISPAPTPIVTYRSAFFPYMKNPIPTTPNTNDNINEFISIKNFSTLPLSSYRPLSRLTEARSAHISPHFPMDNAPSEHYSSQRNRMPPSPHRHLHKALAYITCDDHLLVFAHVNQPEAGIQVPGGTVDPGESPAQTVLREAREETGLSNLTLVSPLGTVDYDMSPFGRNETHTRHFFHLTTNHRAADRWRHYETSGGKSHPKLFELYWAPLTHLPTLIAGHGDLLHRLSVTQQRT